MTYDELLIQADLEGLKVKEKPLQSGDGRIFNNRIAIRRDINTTIEKVMRPCRRDRTLPDRIRRYYQA